MVFELADMLPALPEIILVSFAIMLVLVAAYGGDGAANARRVAHLTMLGIVLATFTLLRICGIARINSRGFSNLVGAL